MVKMKDYSHLTLEQIQEKIDKNDKELQKIWDEDDGSSYDRYCKKCEPYWNDNDALYAAQSLKEVPEMRPFRPIDKKCLMDINTFKDCCKCGGFMDDDGFGYYATETEVSNIEAVPSAFVVGKIRQDFTYVCWYNK